MAERRGGGRESPFGPPIYTLFKIAPDFLHENVMKKVHVSGHENRTLILTGKRHEKSALSGPENHV